MKCSKIAMSTGLRCRNSAKGSKYCGMHGRKQRGQRGGGPSKKITQKIRRIQGNRGVCSGTTKEQQVRDGKLFKEWSAANYSFFRLGNEILGITDVHNTM